ncbi:MAG TPA: winged helix-turn-helix transcriptional regulator [Meiothermus sp.]|nr:winged helix-turn-helix transcriptional regulator [Meiothermus sp.]
MTAKRTYGDGCAAAHALDLVGERWALLVVRELMLGPQRFTDLQAGLPHISPNVLSQRLKDLEKIGVLRRYRLPHPAAVWVYELTDWGMELEPVLQQLGRWGARSPQLPREAPISISTLVMGMRTMFHPPTAEGLKASYELRVGEERLRVRVEEGRLEVQRGSASEPDAILAGDTATLKGLIFAGQPLSAALRSGKLSISGNRRLAERFLRLFKMPEPVPPAGVG